MFQILQSRMTRRVPQRTTASGQHQPGFSVRMEAPLHYSNVMLVDPLSKKPVRVYFKYEDQPPYKRVRLTKGKHSTNSVVPWPQAWKADLTPPATVGDKDTRLEVVNEVTYDPATDFTLQLPSAHLQKKRVKEQRAAAAAEKKAAQHELYKKYRPLLFSKAAAAAGKPGRSSAEGSAADSSSQATAGQPGSVRSYCSSSSEAASSTSAHSREAAGSLLMLQRSRLSRSSSGLTGLLAWCGTQQQQHLQRLSWCGLAAAPVLL